MARDRNGETALMQAAYWGHAETSAELKRLERLCPISRLTSALHRPLAED